MRRAAGFEDFRHLLFVFTAAVCLKVGYWCVCFVFSVCFPLDVDIVDCFGIFAAREVNPAVPREVIYEGDEVHLAINRKRLNT